MSHARPVDFKSSLTTAADPGDTFTICGPCTQWFQKMSERQIKAGNQEHSEQLLFSCHEHLLFVF